MGVPILQKIMTDRQLNLTNLASSFRALLAFSIKIFSQNDVTVNTVSSKLNYSLTVKKIDN
jgi:hypothetical protein